MRSKKERRETAGEEYIKSRKGDKYKITNTNRIYFPFPYPQFLLKDKENDKKRKKKNKPPPIPKRDQIKSKETGKK